MNCKQLIGMTLLGCATIIPLGAIGNSIAMAQTSIDLAALLNTALSKHNGYRTTHHSDLMSIDNAVNTTAQSWAEYLAANQKFEHSTSAQRNGAGENLYVYYTTGNIDAKTLADQAVTSWYNEVSKYDYNTPVFSSTTGHFTQVVWKNSIKSCGSIFSCEVGMWKMKNTMKNCPLISCPCIGAEMFARIYLREIYSFRSGSCTEKPVS